MVLTGVSKTVCAGCGDALSYVGAPFNRWIHLRLPIAQAWTHEARPVEAGSGDSSASAGAPVPARPRPPTLSGGASADLTFDEDGPT